MKRILLLLLTLVFFSGCDEVLIEEYNRIEVYGNLISGETEAVPEIQVFSVGVSGNNLSSNTKKILGRGISGANGNFNFISLDSYSHDLLFAINPSEFVENSQYGSLYFYDLSGNHSKHYNLGEVELARRTDFNLNIVRTPQTQDILRYSLDYENPVKHFVHENGNFIEENDSGNFISLREHLPENDPVTWTLSTVAGSNIKMVYSLGEGPVQEIIIPVSIENNDYDFEY